MTRRRPFGSRRVAMGATAAAVLSVTLAGAGCDAEVDPSGASPGPGGSRPAGRDAERARGDLSGLRVAAESPGAGYSRKKFGVRWKDTDHNGCDQRNDVLARDLRQVRRQGDCVVLGGRLKDPYSGKDITFAKSDAAEVQIDHVYPLALAWRMGASRWKAGRREQFANDHANLLAVWGKPNRQKSDSGPGEWKPQQGFQCAYAIKYVAVATEYGLPVTRDDQGALKGFLARC
ncbi:HNH endonuclease family protein [Actinomadura xylanilytica]|uniref:HNH endonuclease family protein n=1 Tax=Actinomadura xylanilytica TaxID=887459 RepID=UPI00255B2408|nr:HNH endonuclease family protein [Actinomadura xylanilytica]MDL4776257.1 HNH endonuclease family protein [Actinomadura xylanilytica]